MSETTTDTTGTADTADTDGGQGASSATGGDTGKTFTQSELDRIVADRVARERGKYADYGDLKKRAAEAMTAQEKAIADAEERGKAVTLAATSTRLARAELRAAAAGQVDKAALDGFLEYADLSKFVGDDGEPDAKAIEKAVKALAGEPRTTNFDGGARTTAAQPTDMNQLIRSRAGLS